MIESGNTRDLMSRDDRAIARLADRATSDTIFGGARALVLAKRLDRMGGGIDALGVVGDVYQASIGRALPKYRVCKCPECGQTVLGEDAAMRCCEEGDESWG